MRRFSTSIALALSTLLLVSTTSAQQTATTSQQIATSAQPTTDVPTLIRYSGTLKDAQGAVPPGTPLGVTFAIYKQQDGGAAVWQETQNVTLESNGQYSVLLGSTTATGLPGDLFSQQEQRWLGVQVQGQAEETRVLLVSVPYAFKSHDAETLGGLPASAFVQASPSGAAGSTPADTGTALNALTKAGNVSISSKGKGAASRKNTNCAPGTLTASGLGTYIPVFDATVCNLVDSALSQDSVVTPTVVEDSVNFDLSSATNSYQITGSTVLGVAAGVFGSLRNTAVGVGAALGTLYSDNTFVGFSAGSGTNGGTTGDQNTAVGVETGPSGSGNQNSSLGYRAGYGINNGTTNTCVGYQTCYTFDGSSNTMIGSSTGWLNSGNHNSCFGAASCYYMAGNHNVAAGERAGNGPNSPVNNGSFNVLLGDSAGLNISQGSNNTFTGSGAGNTTTNGKNNTFTGFESGFKNTADANTFSGYQSGHENTKGNQNAFFGAYAGLSNMTGNANTFSGWGAGWEHIDGDQNTFSGTSAGFNDYHGKANTFIGASAGQDNGGPGHVSGNINTYVGVGAGLFAFGSNNTFLGDNAGSGVFNASNGNFNTFTGVAAGAANTTGSYNTAYGYQAGIFNASGNSNVYLANLGANESNTIRIGNHGVTGTGNQEQNMVFVDPILWHNTVSPYPDVVTIDNPSGKLGHAPYPTGGGLGGTCGTIGSLAQWLNGTTLGCSVISQMGNNIGIGNPNPSTPLEVGGEITADTWYDITPGELPVLSIDNSPVNSADNNLFVGVGAGKVNTVGTGTGISNTFIGASAGVANTGGTNNIFLGYNAGSKENQNVTGNVDIGNLGPAPEPGTGNCMPNAPCSNQILIGTLNVQTDTYIQGIYNSAPGITPWQTLCVDSNGKLFTIPGLNGAFCSDLKSTWQIVCVDKNGKLFGNQTGFPRCEQILAGWQTVCVDANGKVFGKPPYYDVCELLLNNGIASLAVRGVKS